ncbi:MAG: polysaccharide deacetylase [Clostridia bacterium]|nr:polysaccharide deacetylase [Clostridia bacterium]
MKKNNGKGSTVDFILVLVMFGMVLGCFMAAMSAIVPDSARQQPAVNRVSAFDLDGKQAYDFIETDGKNGLKYYVITKGTSSTASTATTLPSRSETTKKSVQEAAVTTIVIPDVTEETTASVPEETTTATALMTETTQTTTTTTSAAQEQTDRRRVAYLTFDDGPSENTGKILDILDQYDVKATFFVIYHKNMKSTYQEIVNRGHTIALHSYTHSYRKIYKSEEAYFEDLQKIHDYIYDVTGVDSHIMRFPGGSSNTISNKYCKGIMKQLKVDVKERGYVYHDWNVDSTDASGNNRDPEVLLENVKARLTKSRKSNILMHDTGKMKQTTVEALPRIIEYIRSEGYEMERLTDDSAVITHG